MESFIMTDQLRKAFGINQYSKLKSLLAENNVHFFLDYDGKPFTTKEALNSALGVGKSESTVDDGFNIEHLKPHV